MLVYLLVATAHALPLSWLLSTGEVVDEGKWLGDFTHSAAFSAFEKPTQSEPLLPFVAFGLRFDDDLMVALADDGDWIMTEVSRVYLPDGESVWFTLDSRLDGRQFVGLPDDPRAAAIAATFPAPTYSANTRVIETKISDDVTEFHATWNRIDGSPMSLWMEAPDADKPAPKRNGNGMNHSEGEVLAILDLFSLRLVGRRSVNIEGDRAVHTILGKPIAARMRQVVGGVRAGDWHQRGASLVNEEGATVVFQLNYRDDQVWMESIGQPQRLRYRFDKVGEQLQLRQIEVFQDAPDRSFELMQMTFNPSLPDLRFGPPTEPWSGRVAMTVNGQSGWQRGELFMSDQQGSTEILLLSDKPQWASDRPVWTRISHDNQTLSSRILAPGGGQQSSVTVALGAPVTALRSPVMVDFRWDKRPHRLSSLSLSIDATDPSHDVVFLKGGTWADGTFAKDRVTQTVQTVLVTGDELYELVTPRFALLSNSLVPSQSASTVTGEVTLRVPLPKPIDTAQVVPWIRGFNLHSGPAHDDTGITTRGLSIEVTDYSVEADVLTLTVRMEHHIGSVPDRQQRLSRYSAIGQVEFGVAILPENANPKVVHHQRRLDHPRHIFGNQPTAQPCLDKPIWSPLTRWSFVLDPGVDAGRYTRQLTMSFTADGLSDDFDNISHWSRPVHGIFERHFITNTGLVSGEWSCDVD